MILKNLPSKRKRIYQVLLQHAQEASLKCLMMAQIFLQSHKQRPLNQLFLDYLFLYFPTKNKALFGSKIGSKEILEVSTHSLFEFLLIENLGGILSDDMGLGKTIQTLALIVSELKEASNSGPTLIICPTSLINQWASEIQTKVQKSLLSMFLYYGKSRNEISRISSNSPFHSFHIVLTTYGTLSSESFLSKKAEKSQIEKSEDLDGEVEIGTDDLNLSSPLNRQKWHRIVLDEAHNVRNWKTKNANSVFHLNYEIAWCLTGTPIHNSVDDIYSFLRILKINNFEIDRTYFVEKILGPIQRADSERGSLQNNEGFARLQAILTPILLRRKKSDKVRGKPLVSLPKCNIEKRAIEFFPEEVSFYRQFQAKSVELLKDFLQNTSDFQLESDQAVDDDESSTTSYGKVLGVICRLRQACDHPYLPIVSQLVADKAPITLETANESFLGERYRQLKPSNSPTEDHSLEESNTCLLCYENLASPVQTPCLHLFCTDCLGRWLKAQKMVGEKLVCPECNLSFKKGHLRFHQASSLSLPSMSSSVKISSAPGKVPTSEQSLLASRALKALMTSLPNAPDFYISSKLHFMRTYLFRLNSQGKKAVRHSIGSGSQHRD
eukprot:TRINITY_DN5312_c0_g1_i1.p1 TRINITY_DN5312_c0_g1~~TRINITY_DN5312_c0_g1_i1.p1  ORF type:complete len:609 (+),score=118.80 TRINITY_DN5312_c0_g1_i1:488-2314(+)